MTQLSARTQRFAPEEARTRQARARGTAYPPHPELLPPEALDAGPYRLRFARDRADLDAVLRLRFEVFNLELGEGLDSSYLTGRDEDDFDALCHHLMVVDTRSGATIGTYRLQTRHMARAGGFYCDTIFDLGGMPEEVLDRSVELGRACIAPEHRNGRVLFLLWRGIGRYVSHNGLRYLFGCCSLTSQDPDEGLALQRALRRKGHLHPRIRLAPRPGLECPAEARGDLAGRGPKMPPLMGLYLNYGARICSHPAIDREFKTIDFLTLIDIEDIDRKTRRRLLT